MADNSEWETPSGKLTDYEGLVTDAKFALNNRGMLQFILTNQTDNPDIPEWSERYNCGADWVTMDGGETAENTKGINRFTARVGYGKFINNVKGCLSEPNDTPDTLLKKIEEVMGDSPRRASNWIGCRFFYEEFDESFKGSDGENVAYFVNYPTKFLGKDSEITGTPVMNQSPSGEMVVIGENSAAVALNGDPLSVLGEGRAAVLKLEARNLPYSEWSDKVLVAANDAGLLPSSDDYAILITAVADESGLYSSLKG